MYAERLLTLQNGLDLLNFFDNDKNIVPSALAMADGIGGITSITTSIASELESCCAEIKSKLNTIQNTIDKNYKDLNKRVDELSTEILTKAPGEVVNRVVG